MCGDSLTVTEPNNEVNEISNREELTVALKRVGQLWDAQYHSVEGSEPHQLADLICDYEGKS